MSKAQDSFATLESDDEDLLLKAMQAENQERLDVLREAVRELEACEDDDAARAEAYRLLQSTDPQVVPYLVVELWLQMRAMLRNCKAATAEHNRGTFSPSSTRAAERQNSANNNSGRYPPRSKLGTVALPTAQDLQLPEFLPDDSSHDSEEEPSLQPAEETTRAGWKAILGSTTTTHQGLFNQLAANHYPPQLQLASETEDDEAVDVDVTATSYPLLTIHGNEQDKERAPHENGASNPFHHQPEIRKSPTRSPSRQQLQQTQQQQPAQNRQALDGEFIDLGTLPYSKQTANGDLESDMHATRERMGALSERFSPFASENEARLPVVEKDDDDLIMATAATDPAKRNNSTAVPDVLTSNDDLNEEIIASLARLARLYGEDVSDGAMPKFAELREHKAGVRHKQSRFVDKNGRVLEDDDHDVYAHFFGAGPETDARTAEELQSHRGYSFTVPTAHELGQSRRPSSSASKKVKRKAPTPITSTVTTPQKEVRSLARPTGGNKQGTSPLAQKPRRVSRSSASAVSSSSRRPASAPHSGRPSSARATAASAAKTTRRQAPTPTRRTGPASK